MEIYLSLLEQTDTFRLESNKNKKKFIKNESCISYIRFRPNPNFSEVYA